jgi:uncharacterized membrane protein YccC
MTALSTMPGGEVLALVRDIIANEAARIRSLEDGLMRLGVSRSISHDRLALILALNAAADVFTLVLAAVQDEKLRSAPRNDYEAVARKAPMALIQQIANQARAAMTKDGSDPRDDGAADEHAV